MSAGDFYFAINATFRQLHETYGEEALIAYWTAMAREYHAGVAELFRRDGLAGAHRYWEDYFAAEPGGTVIVSRTEREVEIEVQDCPAIRWLVTGGREVVPYYCQHCRYISGAIAAQAGMKFELSGGGGTCHQVFSRVETNP